jgi:DNA replication protein DnaC
VEAAQSGFEVHYTTMAALMDDLRRANKNDGLTPKLRFLAKPSLVILDEIGYQALRREDAEVFFQFVTRRYERGSTILTSNKPFTEWGELLGDAVLASAVLDRLLHHATVVSIKGDSFRLKERRRLISSSSSVASAAAGAGGSSKR